MGFSAQRTSLPLLCAPAWFMVRSTSYPVHWLYYLYSGLAFAIGTTRYHLRKWRSLASEFVYALMKVA
jgi:hypothetical protein